MLKAYSTRLAQKNSSLKIEKKTKLVKTIKKTRTNSKFKIKSEKKSIKMCVFNLNIIIYHNTINLVLLNSILNKNKYIWYLIIFVDILSYFIIYL